MSQITEITRFRNSRGRLVSQFGGSSEGQGNSYTLERGELHMVALIHGAFRCSYSEK
jgi:hypothetical protein